MNTYIIGEALTEIKKLPENTFELIYTNPPYATTNKSWDQPLDWVNLIPELWRVLKPDGVIALHTGIPFTYDIIRLMKPKYNYIWKKNNPTNPLLAKKQPLRNIEEILIFYKKNKTYNPQMEGEEEIEYNRTNSYDGYYGKQTPNKSKQKGKYPTTYLGSYPRIIQSKNPKSIHDSITEKIIKTYTNEGDNILDFTCCSRGNGDIASKLNRHYLGIDISAEFL